MILIRCNAGSHVGLGHLVRCRVLAQAIRERNGRALMIGASAHLQNPGDTALFDDWIERPDWTDAQTEADFHIALARDRGASHVVMDDYRSDFEHQLKLREAGLRTLQQYDPSLPQRFAAHLLASASPAERREAYENVLLTPDIEMLLGPRYAVLRNSFLSLQPKPADEVKRILVTFGGGDDGAATLKVLEALSTGLPGTCRLIAVTGKLNPHNEEIQAWLGSRNAQGIEWHVDPDNMAAVIASCDIAVLSGGTTICEAAYCGLPMVLLPTAANQYAQAQGWEELGAAVNLGPYEKVDMGKLRSVVLDLASAADRRMSMSQAGRKHVDGRGAERLLDRLLEVVAA